MERMRIKKKEKKQSFDNHPVMNGFFEIDYIEEGRIESKIEVELISIVVDGSTSSPFNRGGRKL